MQFWREGIGTYNRIKVIDSLLKKFLNLLIGWTGKDCVNQKLLPFVHHGKFKNKQLFLGLTTLSLDKQYKLVL